MAAPTSETIWSSAGERIFASRVQASWSRSDLHTERYEPLLGPVVQVALEAPALFVARFDDARTRGLDLGELQPNLDAQACHLDRECGGGEDAVDEIVSLEQCRIVEQDGRRCVVASLISRRARSSCGSSSRRPPVCIGAYAPVSVIQKKISASGSCNASASTTPISSGARTPSRTSSSNARDPSNSLVASPAVSAVDQILDSCAQRAETQAPRRESPARRPTGVATDDDAQPDRDGRVDREEQERQRHVDERAIDESLDRVQAVAHDRDLR